MRILLVVFCILFLSCNHPNKSQPDTAGEYTGKEFKEMQQQLATGWNTWNTRSVLSHVLLPDYIAINLKLKNDISGDILEEALIGRRGEQGKQVEKINPGEHAYDGSYTSLEIEWQGMKAQIQSAVADSELVILVTPLQKNSSGLLIVEPTMLWNKTASIKRSNDTIIVNSDRAGIQLFNTGAAAYPGDSTTLSFSLNDTTGISTGSKKTVQQIETIIHAAKSKLASQKEPYQKEADLYNAMQRVLAWDVIYEPVHQRVIAPVSRIWSAGMWGGWVLFDWDTYFSSLMFAMDNKELSYSNAIAITHEITNGGFIPNFAAGLSTSNDRSQPPVGSLVIKALYKNIKTNGCYMKYLTTCLPGNRWWDKNRQLDGYLCWGSSPYQPEPTEPEWLTQEVNKIQGAKWESGLDNSPMYDGAAFDTSKHVMLLADVGLIALYINDCDNLIEIATELGKKEIVEEIKTRREKYAAALQTLWDERTGLFLNKHLDNKTLSHRLSPTLFYPLLAGVATQQQAERMIKEHFYNKEEFWGNYIMPSIAKNDTAYKDQDYWRGRIWAPMNFLVYLGLRNYLLPDAQKDMAEKSKNLILRSWLSEGAVYENYNGITGQGDDVGNSDKFYHWGALLAYITFIENGYVVKPEVSIDNKIVSNN